MEQDQTVERLRVLGIIGFAVILAVIGCAFLLQLNWEMDQFSRILTTNQSQSAMGRVQTRINDQIRILSAELTAFTSDSRLETLLESGDALALDRLSRPAFERLKQDHNLSHLYFIAPNRTIIHRLHWPAISGDRVDRQTVLDAERTGHQAQGFDLGIDGALRLRVVAPYRGQDGHVAGYVEAAVEAADVLAEAGLNMAATIITVPKPQIDQAAWAKTHGSDASLPPWDTLPNDIAVSSVGQPATLTVTLLRDLSPGTEPQKFTTSDGHILCITVQPLTDARGASVAKIITVSDQTEAFNGTTQRLRGTALVVFLGSILLVAMAYFSLRFLEQRLAQANQKRQEMEHIAKTDSLNGLLCRREFDHRLEESLRHPGNVGLIMIDIDHFKQVNDTYGHPAGDAVLRALAHDIGENLRPSEIFARYGGEEFALIIPGADADLLSVLAERIRRIAAAIRVDINTTHSIGITISIGTAMAWDNASPSDLLAAADAALYRAKHQGRNLVCAAECDVAVLLA